jgi:hypothetical protein
MSRSKYEIALLAIVVAIGVLPLSNPSYAVASDSSGLPNALVTPGATNPAVTQSTIGSTICVVGYTKTIRPPVSYTNSLKRSQLASGYNLNGDLNTADYEEDHLIPLALGGSPSIVKNLWPEPRNISRGAGLKDRLENKMHLMVCAGVLTLKAAQKVFMQNWILGYHKYIGALA